MANQEIIHAKIFYMDFHLLAQLRAFSESLGEAQNPTAD